MGISTKVKNAKNTSIFNKKMDMDAPKNEYRVPIEKILDLELDRKTKEDQDAFFTETVLEQILDLVERGNILEDAAREVYLEPSIARRWYDENHKNFKYAIEQAAAYAKHTQINSVVKGYKSWQAAGWWLERRYPYEYLKKDGEEKKEEPEKDQVMKIGNQIIKF